MRYVILRSTGAQSRGFPGVGPAGVRNLKSPVVEVDDLQHQSAATLARKRDILALAPVVPMKLIVPVAKRNIDLSTHDGVAWGVEAVAADSSPFTGEGVVVAVLDTGIDASHSAFAGVELIQKNFTEDNEADENGHGTHCAGIIFGRSVDGVRIGVAPGVSKALIGKVIGKGGGSDQVVQAIQWAVNDGANVVSMSLGIDFPGYVRTLEEEGVPTELAASMALEGYRANVTLFERLASFIAVQSSFRGTTLLVAAAGNESRRDLRPDFEIAVSPPAVADGIVSVAGIGRTSEGFTVAPFSNVGARVSAPGVAIDSAALGSGLISMDGTSMAAPHVAGVAALWAQKISKQEGLIGKLLIDRLVGTASTAGMKIGFHPAQVGAGVVQAPQA